MNTQRSPRWDLEGTMEGDGLALGSAENDAFGSSEQRHDSHNGNLLSLRNANYSTLDALFQSIV